MRLFFALWPDSSTQLQWHQELAPWLARLGGRRIPAEKLHLTLAFLGEVAGDGVNRLMALGDDLDHSAIALRFPQIECWRQSGVACLRPSETPAALTRLAGQLQTGLQLAGFRHESRRFKPHVTLARDIAVVGPALPVWPVLEWQAPAIVLVRSRLMPEGSDYAVLSSWPLG